MTSDKNTAEKSERVINVKKTSHDEFIADVAVSSTSVCEIGQSKNGQHVGTTCSSLECPTSPCSTSGVVIISNAKLYWRFAGSFCALFTAGWADGVTGTILPHFQLTYMLSSLLFITSTAGFALGVLTIEKLMNITGTLSLHGLFLPWSKKSNTSYTRGCKSRATFRILLLGGGLHACFFILMGTANGFANVLSGYFLASLGKAFLNGTLNAFIAASPRRPLGLLYACNALGALFGPLVCQNLLAKSVPWQHFYLGTLVLSTINLALLAFSFSPTKSELEESGILSRPDTPPPMSSDNATQNRLESEKLPVNLSTAEKGRIDQSSSLPSSCQSALLFALRLRQVWAFSFFMWIYSGSETSTQGYMATYLLAVRNANPKAVGYVSSGFWGGMAISRFATGVVTPYLTFTQRKHAIHIILGEILYFNFDLVKIDVYSNVVSALSMHLTIWFINSVFENAFSTAIIGLLYGPVYPTILSLAVDLLPSEAHMITMAIISGFANLGSSIFPFLAGAMSNIRGPKVLVYMTVAQTVTLIAIWTFSPKKARARD